ncbi:MAG: type VI secretion system baseplate subunit TssG [Acidobacteriia bacterium]|nr:type VI secretion system baseplate subunit TssG [Terriglobia bacterium]
MADTLTSEPYRFDFFQAVRLVARMLPGRQVVGRFSNPGEECLRFGANPSTAFPASQVQSLEPADSQPMFMRVNFMGLTGPTGVLPLAYSELVLERIRARDYALRDFYDLFNHRSISLFYQAWEKYRFEIPYERGERDRFSHHILALLGLGTPGLQDRQDVPDDSLLFYSGLLSMHARSASGLRALLADYFDVPVEIEQFVGVWRPVEIESQCSLGETGGYSEQLGLGAVVGDEIWDQQSRVRIRFGPLALEQYHDFLPGSEAYRQARALATFYAGGEYDVEIQLILRRDEVPACELRAEREGWQLGWTSWVKNAAFQRDPGDTVLEL